jgi:hypothetical protein
MSISLFPNKQKKNHELWGEGRDLLNIPCPSRIVLAGKPNSGKTSIILNIILKAKPHYQKIWLMHPALKSSEDESDVEDEDISDEIPEYSMIDYTPLYEWPVPKFFDNGYKKQLLIVDDCELRTMKKEQKKRMNKCISYASSHYNLTVVISSQDVYSQIPPCVLRFANVVAFWRFSDLRYLRMLLDNLGVPKRDKDDIIDEIRNYGTHDFLLIDHTENAPAKYRKNAYIPVLTHL